MTSRQELLSTLIAVTLLMLGSCKEQKSRFEVRLDDSVEQVIFDYIKETHIDTRSKVITTRWVASSVRTDVYISNYPKKFSQAQFDVPAYYSVLGDSIVVFLYSGVEGSISRDITAISRELDDVLKRHHVRLHPADSSFYRAPTWIYSFCDTSRELVKRSSPYALYEIPCGHVLMQDSVKLDSLIIKRN